MPEQVFEARWSGRTARADVGPCARRDGAADDAEQQHEHDQHDARDEHPVGRDQVPESSHGAVVSPFGIDARIEQRIQQVENQERQADAQDDEQHHALDDEVVIAGDSSEQQKADARIGEDDFDQDGAGHDAGQRDGQSGDLRQQRIAQTVLEKDRAPAQPFGLGQRHVILAERVDHHRAHAQTPETDAGENDRRRRQIACLAMSPTIGQVSARRAPEV